MADVWRQGGGRLRWTCVVPTLTMEEAINEVRFARENGAVGVALRAYDHGLMITDPVYYPLFEEATRLDMSMTVHVSNGSSEFEDLIKSRYPVRAGFVASGLPAVASCFALLSSEVPRVFPKLRWAFVEASAGWIPWVLHNLVRRHGADYPKNPFAAYNVYVTTQMDDDHSYILDYVGEDVLVLGTDYGHSDVSSEVDSMQLFRKLDTVSDRVKDRVLSENPAKLYGITAS
jgi:predicted TIM-barrel fold metal-dependent hydrolase